MYSPVPWMLPAFLSEVISTFCYHWTCVLVQVPLTQSVIQRLLWRIVYFGLCSQLSRVVSRVTGCYGLNGFSPKIHLLKFNSQHDGIRWQGFGGDNLGHKGRTLVNGISVTIRRDTGGLVFSLSVSPFPHPSLSLSPPHSPSTLPC